MKVANLYEATEVLERAGRAVIGAEHEIDMRANRLHGTNLGIDVMLLEHDMPDTEPFPNKKSLKRVAPKIKGNTPLKEIEKLIDL